MKPVTVALFIAFSCRTCTAATGAGMFGYPDDDHVIITQYGPMRYDPITADDMNRPYDGGGNAQNPPGRGYYKAEVIPLDMKTWKPVSGASWVGRGPVGGDAGDRAGDSFDVPLRVGYSMRPTAAPVRRRRHDYFLTGYPPTPPTRHPQRRPGVARLPSKPAAAVGHLWRF